MLKPSGKCQSVKITIRYFLLLWYRCMGTKKSLYQGMFHTLHLWCFPTWIIWFNWMQKHCLILIKQFSFNQYISRCNSTASKIIYYISTCFGPHLQIAIPYSIVMLEVVMVSCITCFAISSDQQYYTSVVFYWDWFHDEYYFLLKRMRFPVVRWLVYSWT